MTSAELSELAQDLSFEKWVLDESLLAMPDSTRDVIDLRGFNAIIGMHTSSSLSGDAVTKFRDKVLLPLLFGTAWKMIDLIVERVWQTLGGPAKPTIAAKVERTISNPNEVASFVCGDQPVIDRVMAVYRNTSSLRHALVHRRVSRTADGGLEESSGQQISKQEILALCMVCRRLIESVGRTIDPREQSELAWHLNQLHRLHEETDLQDAYAPRPIDLVKVLAVEIDGCLTVDVNRAKSKAKSVNGGFPYADLQVYFPDGQSIALECRLEDAPDGDEVRLDAMVQQQNPGLGLES
jgi:hypothetical protein